MNINEELDSTLTKKPKQMSTGLHSQNSQDLMSDVMKEKKFGSVANTSVQFAVNKQALFMNAPDDDTIQGTEGKDQPTDTIRDTFDEHQELQSEKSNKKSEDSQQTKPRGQLDQYTKASNSKKFSMTPQPSPITCEQNSFIITTNLGSIFILPEHEDDSRIEQTNIELQQTHVDMAQTVSVSAS